MRNMSFAEAACTLLPIQQEWWLPFPWVSAFVALCVSEGCEAAESSWKAGGSCFSVHCGSSRTAFHLLLAKAEVGDVWLGDAGDDVCPKGERVVLRGLKSLHRNLICFSWNACMLKMVKIADAGEQSIFVRHLSPNHIPFKRGALLGKSLLCRPPAAFLTSQKGHVKTNVIKRVFKVLFKACWLFCRGFWSCRIGKFDCSSAMTQNFAAGSHQRGHAGN